LAAGTAFLALYVHFSKGLPEVPRVEDYSPPILTEFRSDDGYLVGEFFRERRKVVPYETIPKKLIQAFVAAEDKNFFDHFGIDLEGTLRAASITLRGGRKVQGGSTLTQQTAKAILISTEGYKKSTVRKGKEGLIRKIREAILAHRLETSLTKEEILYLYLNNVYLGHHSYGVEAAAENYFRKDVRDLSLAEIALLAGLPQSPSRNPFAHPQASKDRRSYVLRRMYEEGMISEDEREKADRTPVKAFDVEDPFHEVAPFFAEQVRRDVVERYGNERLLNQGLQVDLTMDAERQRAAQAAMLAGLIEVDKRQGFYGALLHLGTPAEEQAFLAKIDKVMGKEEIENGGYYPALVKHIDDKQELAEVTVGAHRRGVLPLAGMRWARKPNPEAYYPSSLISHVKTALKEGDVVLVRARTAQQLQDETDSTHAKQVPTEGQLFDLEQEPQLQGAIVSIDPHKNYVPAIIGGYDFDASEFNRAFQACRQPGSAFKPIEYSAAIEQKDYTASTILVDSPIVEDDPDTQLRWKPENYESDFKGDVIVRTALMESMNIPAIKVFRDVGIDNVRAWAKKLGLSTEVHADLSSALGSSCVHPWELANVYAVFDRDGRREPVYFLRQVRDRYGRVLEDHTAYDDPWASLDDRLRTGYARLFDHPEQVMEPETAFLTTYLLHDVATGGTGAQASRLGKPVAGKTGTTNDSHDTWFVGFTRDLLTAVWLGYDDYKHDPMAKYEAGSKASLPIWLDYMKRALDGVPQPSFQPPAGADIVFRTIDPKTGKLAMGKGGVIEAYKRGNEPTPEDAAAPEQDNPMMLP
jgi:penicillin-binding protein 1A